MPVHLWSKSGGALRSGRVIQLRVQGKAVRGLPDVATFRVDPVAVDSNLNRAPDHNEPIYVSTSTDQLCDFRPQDQLGAPVKDFIVSTFHIHTHHQSLGFDLEFFDKLGKSLGKAYLEPQLFSDISSGNLNLKIESGADDNFASVMLFYTIIRPFVLDSVTDNQLNSNTRYQWVARHKHKVFHAGHRGLGIGRRKDTTFTLENTIHSFSLAAQAGADMIELDVSLTRDSEVIVYHDLELVHIDTGKTRSIKDMTYSELLSENLRPVNKDLLSSERRSFKFYDSETDSSNRPFVRLREVFKQIKPTCAINVEIKFPHRIEAGHWLPHEPEDLNYYVDTILETVFMHAGKREIVFSSFDAGVCTCVQAKQNKYPVLFLTRGSRAILPRPMDLRMMMIEHACYHARAMELAGVDVYAMDVLHEQYYVNIAKKLGLIMVAWWGPLTVKELRTLIHHGVNGLIYDDIDIKLPQLKELLEEEKHN